jgi:methanogenic corrinoid protein MtbC1
LDRERGAPEGTVVLGVMDGPWTIGTGIVSTVLQANNFGVIDAGSDVTPERIVATAVDAKADVVAVGMYLSCKFDLVRRLADGLAAAGLRQSGYWLIIPHSPIMVGPEPRRFAAHRTRC